MQELWSTYYIEKYGNIFVSNLGNVQNKNGKMLSKRQKQDKLNPYYYIRVNYTEDGKRKIWQQYIHRLVAICFIHNPETKPEVNHKDGNKLNNNIDNLEWCTRKENMEHAVRNGLVSLKIGENNGRSHLTEKNVLDIREKYEYGEQISKLARLYNVGWTTISHIVKKESWSHI